MEDSGIFIKILKFIFLITSIVVLLIALGLIQTASTCLLHVIGGFLFGFIEPVIPELQEYFSLLAQFPLIILPSAFLLIPEIYGIQKVWKLLKKSNKHEYIPDMKPFMKAETFINKYLSFSNYAQIALYISFIPYMIGCLLNKQTYNTWLLYPAMLLVTYIIIFIGLYIIKTGLNKLMQNINNPYLIFWLVILCIPTLAICIYTTIMIIVIFLR